MKKIDNIASVEGRLLLHDIYHKFKFEQQRNSISSLLILWRLCTAETDVSKYINEDIIIVHKLGLLQGTFIWLEEVVNRYYFSTINSFVYFGAAIFLVLVGLNRFTDKIDNTTVIAGLIFEAAMLLLMFLIMLFTPNDDVLDLKQDLNEDNSLQKELLDEIGEISRDFAVTSSQLDKVSNSLSVVSDKQNELFLIMSDIVKTNADAARPNPKMLEAMNETNAALVKFNDTVILLNETASKLKSVEIEIAVRKEIENFFTNKIS